MKYLIIFLTILFLGLTIAYFIFSGQAEAPTPTPVVEAPTPMAVVNYVCNNQQTIIASYFGGGGGHDDIRQTYPDRHRDCRSL